MPDGVILMDNDTTEQPAVTPRWPMAWIKDDDMFNGMVGTPLPEKYDELDRKMDHGMQERRDR